MSDLNGEPQKIGHAIKQEKWGPSGCMTCMKLMQPEGPDFRQHILSKKNQISNYFDFLTSKNLSKLSDLSGFDGIWFM